MKKGSLAYETFNDIELDVVLSTGKEGGLNISCDATAECTYYSEKTYDSPEECDYKITEIDVAWDFYDEDGNLVKDLTSKEKAECLEFARNECEEVVYNYNHWEFE